MTGLMFDNEQVGASLLALPSRAGPLPQVQVIQSSSLIGST